MATTKIKYDDAILKLADIKINPKNFRRKIDNDKLLDLSKDVALNGLLNPLTVRKLDPAQGEQHYMLVAGERRLRACHMAKLETVPVRVVSGEGLTEADFAIIGFVENLDRENLSTYETARGAALLVDEYAMSGSEVAKRVGKSTAYVNKLIKGYTVLHPTITKQWEEGNGLLTTARLERLQKMDDKEEQLTEWASVVENGCFTDEMETPDGAEAAGEGGEGGTVAETSGAPTPWEMASRLKVKERHSIATRNLNKMGEAKVTPQWCLALVNYVLGRREKPPEGIVEPEAKGKRAKKRPAGEARAEA